MKHQVFGNRLIETPRSCFVSKASSLGGLSVLLDKIGVSRVVAVYLNGNDNFLATSNKEAECVSDIEQAQISSGSP